MTLRFPIPSLNWIESLRFEGQNLYHNDHVIKNDNKPPHQGQRGCANLFLKKTF